MLTVGERSGPTVTDNKCEVSSDMLSVTDACRKDLEPDVPIYRVALHHSHPFADGS